MANSYISLSVLAEKLASVDTTAEQLVSDSFARIEKVDGRVHAFLDLYKGEATKRALSIDKKRKSDDTLPPLSGVPIGVKDNIMIAGKKTTAGSKMLESYLGAYDAFVIQKLREAGAVIVGKTNMDEFAMGSSTETSYFGATRNPWDVGRVPGGSSGGSAAAVAAGEVPVALGSDTGGSIRQPASYCGVVGYKPTYGAVSRRGLLAMASSLDQISVCARSVEDVVLLSDMIIVHDEKDATSLPETGFNIKGALNGDLKGMRVGVPKEFFGEGLDQDVKLAIEKAITILKEQGVEIKEVTLPMLKHALAVYYILMPAEASANLARYDGVGYGHRTSRATQALSEDYAESRAEALGDEVKRRIMLGTYVLSTGYCDAYYKQAQRVQAKVTDEFRKTFSEVDVLVGPTAPTPAFKLGEQLEDPLTMYLNDVYTVPMNIAGLPAVSIPAGFVEREGDRLPVGLQIIGPQGGDVSVLSVGRVYQEATEWHKESPSL